MADFVSAEITQEIIDAKNKLNQQAERAKLIVDSWEGGVANGDMLKATYDPQNINADAFDRANHTGSQAISTITNLQSTLDSKASTTSLNDLETSLQGSIDLKANQTEVDSLTLTVASKADASALDSKQDTLVSGTTIKTINGESLLGSGNIVISGGGGGAVDSVNGQTGVVVLDANDIAETATRIYFTPAEQTKLAGIEAGANNYTLPNDVVQDASYVHTDNNYTDGEKTKLAGIESGANNYTLPSDVVQDATYVKTDNNYTTAEKNKLAGIEAGAQVNEVTQADLNGKEDSLGNPASDGQILSSLTDGTRSWIDAPSGGGGGAPVAITPADLASYTTVNALGEGVYTVNGSTSQTGNEVPYVTTGNSYRIEVKAAGEGYYVEAYSIRDTGGIVMTKGGKWHKYFMPQADATDVNVWQLDSIELAQSSLGGSLAPDLTNYSSILAGINTGKVMVGEWYGTGINSGSSPWGAGGASVIKIELARNYTNGSLTGFIVHVRRGLTGTVANIEAGTYVRHYMANDTQSPWVQFTGTAI